MNRRAIPSHFTPEQRAFLSSVTATPAHIFLRATAGAGKTTTLLEAAWHLQQHGVYFAYNKHAVSDLQPRLPRQVRARTLHAHGLGLLNSQTSGLELVRDKGRQVAARVMRGSRSPLYAAARAWDIAREETLVRLTLADAERLAARTDWRGHPRELQELIPAMHEAGDLLWQSERSADYTDMLWLPVRHAYGHHSVRLALVDEAQDLTPLRQQFVQHLLGLPDSTNPGQHSKNTNAERGASSVWAFDHSSARVPAKLKMWRRTSSS
ncbi:hypothetical protein DESA109040_16695 [Deinococcus saxicola]|uniref:AAA family ATPase n=1 Tax=Deinococcus saxicola TaxID=249406 RepID=UPI0039F0E85C